MYRHCLQYWSPR